jgi:SAM-dependent methyltransferase
MLQLRYCFDSTDWIQLLQLQALKDWLQVHLLLKLESHSRPQHPALYPLFSRPMLQTDIRLTQSSAFQPDPACGNVHWWYQEPLVTGLHQADEIWSLTPAGVTVLKEAFPDKPVAYMPPCLQLADWQEPTPPPPDLELGVGQSLLLWLAPHENGLTEVLKAFLPLAQAHPHALLMLQIDTVQPAFEDRLVAQLESLAATHGITQIEHLNIHTLIGPLESGPLRGLLQQTSVLINPPHPLLALAARGLGKQVLCHTGLLPDHVDCLIWHTDPAHNTQALQQALETRAVPLPAQILKTFSPDEVGEKMLERLNHLRALIDLPTRRLRVKTEREQQAAAAREGRKQKYSLFHSDYKSDEMQARRLWHARYANYFTGVSGDILDIGCGSGIFLEILRDLGLPACGIDPDPEMVAVCQELGLQALTGDERLLGEYPPDSLGGIHASHVIEHVDGTRAIALVENALAALKPGGLLLIRTPNWRNDTVRHEGFWLDITHIRPYPLPLLEQVFKDAGFEITASGFEEFGWNDTFIVGRKPGGL